MSAGVRTAGLYYHYGVRKELLPEKMFGVFEHRVTALQPAGARL